MTPTPRKALKLRFLSVGAGRFMDRVGSKIFIVCVHFGFIFFAAKAEVNVDGVLSIPSQAERAFRTALSDAKWQFEKSAEAIKCFLC